ncbi:MAG TPA: FecR domain-containing protein [Candidatus Sulfotelmatobacter sp.]|nr:FecR domain-containing protein [Candidatus Sulfotelmatobacter sp.]
MRAPALALGSVLLATLVVSPAARGQSPAASASGGTEQTAGVTTASNPSVEGVPPVSAPGPLLVGVTVFEHERVISAADGQAQLLFRDGSSFTVGPNSNLTLDDFTFDPGRGTGRAALSLGKGIFRFVGGKLSKEGAVELTTPAAVLGVRGGIALVEVGDQGATKATLLYGSELAVTARDGETVRIRRPGFSVTVAYAGAAPSEPVRVTADDLRHGLDPLRGQPDRTGGLPMRPPPPFVVAALRAPVVLAGPSPSGAPGAGSGSNPPPNNPPSGNAQSGSPPPNQPPGGGPGQAAGAGPPGGGAGLSVPSPFANAGGPGGGLGAGPGPGPGLAGSPGGARPIGAGPPGAGQAGPPPGPPAGQGAQARQRRMLAPTAP